MIRIFSDSIADTNTKNELDSLVEQLNKIVLLRGQWQFVTITLSAAATNYKFPHQLGIVPKDVIVLSNTGAGAITWNYSSFSSTQIDITTTGAIAVRAFIGTYQEG